MPTTSNRQLDLSEERLSERAPVIKRLGLVTQEASSSSGFSGLGSNADFLLTCLMTVFRSGACSNPSVCESLVTSHLLDS